MSEVVPFMEEIGIRVPAHFDAELDRYVIDCPFPAQFDSEKREWLLEDGAIDWNDVLERWRGRGPMNRDYVTTLQRGYQTTSLRRSA
jgi:ring-1,2-phenylacetyl-CoA epoxidase subunit PaaA